MPLVPCVKGSAPVTTCIFCRIAAGAVPAYTIHEDALTIAFLDIRPIRPGHAQVIPRQHFDYFDDLPGPEARRIIEVGQRLARAMKQLFGVPRVGLVFSGGDIAHAHAHIVPMHETTDITSRRYILDEEVRFAATPRAAPGELAAAATALSALMADGG